MLKKYMLFGSVVLLVAALFATGCSQATDGGTTLLVAENHLYGNIGPAEVAKAVAAAERDGRAVVLTDGTVINDSTTPGAWNLPSVVDFKGLPVQVQGHVTFSGNIILNAAKASLSFAEGSGLLVDGGAVFIYSGDHDKIDDNSNSGFKVKYMTGTDEVTAGQQLMIAVDKFDYDQTVASYVKTIYVLDEITVTPTSAPKPSLGIIALGNVVLSGSPAATFFTSGFSFARSATLINGAAAGITIALPGASTRVALPKVEARQPITLTSEATGFGIQIDKVIGPGKLSVSAATSFSSFVLKDVAADAKVEASTPGALPLVEIINTAAGSVVSVSAASIGASGGTGVTIGGAVPTGNPAAQAKNNGTITLTTVSLAGPVDVTANTGSLTLDAAAITGKVTVTKNDGTLSFEQPLTTSAANLVAVPTNNGTITFDALTTNATGGTFNGIGAGPVKGSGTIVFNGAVTLGAAASFGNDVVLSKGLSLTGGTLTFGGNVTLPYNQTISASATANTITLNANKVIQIGPVDAPIPVLAAGSSAVTLTPKAGGAILTAGAVTADTEEDDPEYSTLHITAPIASFTNDLIVKAGSILKSDLTGAFITVINNSKLILEAGEGEDDGAAIEVPSGSSDFGYVTLGVLGTAYTVLAGGITAGDSLPARYIARGNAVTLSATSISGNNATLAVWVDGGNGVIGVNGPYNLTLEGVNLDLSENGNVKVNSSTLTLVGGNRLETPGKITLAEVAAEAGTFNFTGSGVTFGGGTITGIADVYTSNVSGEEEPTIEAIAANPASKVVISGNATIDMDATLTELP